MWLLAFVPALLFGQATAPLIPNEVSEADLRSVVISLDVDGVYTVKIAGDGLVTYEGRSDARTAGLRTHNVPTAAVRSLLEEFQHAKFESFNTEYRTITRDGMQKMAGHAYTTTLSLSLNGTTRSVKAGYGTPSELRRLEDRVLEVSGVRRYTGRPSPLPRMGSVRGRIVDSQDRPLQGVTIRLLGNVVYEQVTDHDGLYAFSWIWPSSYWVTVRRDGYVPVNHDLDLPAANPDVRWNTVMATESALHPEAEMIRQLTVYATELSSCGFGASFQTPSGWTEPTREAQQGFMRCLLGPQNHVWTGIQRPSASWAADGLMRLFGDTIFKFSYENRQLKVEPCPAPSLVVDPSSGRSVFVCGG
jgi:hypothetical protein